MSAPAESVTITDVTKRFGRVEAVRDLDLAIGNAEFFTLLGPSGCGKTTTLRMIAGFEDPTEGHLLIDGRPVAGLPPDKRPTNTVFQSYALFPHLSVGDNVAFGLRRKGVAKDETRRRVRDELERVGLAEEIDRRPAQLSGGQQQRVALARALVNLPKVLLLDEPLGALDLKLRKQLQIELKRIQREVGVTFVYVTHDQEEALTMSDRIAVMNKGRLEQVGQPDEIYERPATTFVADFIGVSNVVPAELTRVDGGEGAFAVLRPEKLRIGPPGATPGLEGIVRECIYLGSATQLLVRVRDGHEMKVLIPNSGDDAAEVPSPGTTVGLTWSPEHVHVVRESPTAVT